MKKQQECIQLFKENYENLKIPWMLQLNMLWNVFHARWEVHNYIKFLSKPLFALTWSVISYLICYCKHKCWNRVLGYDVQYISYIYIVIHVYYNIMNNVLGALLPWLYHRVNSFPPFLKLLLIAYSYHWYICIYIFVFGKS